MTTTHVLGITDDVTTCGLCGREDLKSTVLLDTPDGVIYAGSDCAGKALGRPGAEISRAAAKADKDSRAAADAARFADRLRESVQQDRALAYWTRTTYGCSILEAEALPGMTPFTLRKAFRAAPASERITK
jgi:hypothetical protein